MSPRFLTLLFSLSVLDSNKNVIFGFYIGMQNRYQFLKHMYMLHIFKHYMLCYTYEDMYVFFKAFIEIEEER